MSERKTKTVRLPFEPYPEKLAELIRWLDRYLDCIPIEYRDNARCRAWSDESYDPPVSGIQISYERVETDAEMAQRLEEEAERAFRPKFLAENPVIAAKVSDAHVRQLAEPDPKPPKDLMETLRAALPLLEAFRKKVAAGSSPRAVATARQPRP